MREALRSRAHSQPSQAPAAKASCSGAAGRCACDDCGRDVPISPSRPAHHFADVRVAANERGGPLDELMPPGIGRDEDESPMSRFRRGGALPYRQAAEYSECLRILGPDATAECRQLVLGEKPTSPCNTTVIRDPMSDISTFQSPGASGWFGARFGCFRDRCRRRHRGWDIHAAVGTEIVAAQTGRVTLGNDPGGWGLFVRLRADGDPTRTFIYAHLSAREPAGHYCSGARIGATGTTGNADAARPHLHFEVQVNGAAVDPDTLFPQPTNVVEAVGTPVTAINPADPEPCIPCGM